MWRGYIRPTPTMTEIVYDRITHQYALYLDGVLVGYAATYHDGDTKLQALQEPHGQLHDNP